MEGKTCRKCNEFKPFSEFHKNSRDKDRGGLGFYSRCKVCVKISKLSPKQNVGQHFGVKLQQKPSGFKLTRDNYIDKITFKSRDSKEYYYLNIEEHTERRLYNFDLNMKYFNSLSKDEFNIELENFIGKTKVFKEITDLNTVNDVSGYYIMVLDEYNQVYIGTSGDIKKRIQSHWSKQKEFDRLIFGSKEDSILSIDSFRAFDTTRIFVYPTYKTYDLEDKFINHFKSKYLLNRTSGGSLTGLDEAIVNRKARDQKLIVVSQEQKKKWYQFWK